MTPDFMNKQVCLFLDPPSIFGWGRKSKFFGHFWWGGVNLFQFSMGFPMVYDTNILNKSNFYSFSGLGPIFW